MKGSLDVMLTGSGAQVALLVAARTLPISLLAPFWGLRGLPIAVPLGIAATLSITLCPLAASATQPPAWGSWLWALALLREVLVGTSLGLAVAGPLWAARWAGRWLERGAAPTEALRAPISTFYLLSALAIFSGMGGHRAVVRLFADSLESAPPGQLGPLLQHPWQDASAQIGVALGLAVQLALPALAAALLVDLGLALSRLTLPRHGQGEGMNWRPVVVQLMIAIGLLWTMDALPEAMRRALQAASALWT